MSELIHILKALSDETRFALIQLLLQHNYCVGALSKQLNITESAVSQHLKVLRTAGIVKGEKRGYYTHYYVDRELLREAASSIVTLSTLAPAENKCRKNTISNQPCCKEGDLL